MRSLLWRAARYGVSHRTRGSACCRRLYLHFGSALLSAGRHVSAHGVVSKASRCQLSTSCLPSSFFFSFHFANHIVTTALGRKRASSCMRTSIPRYPSLEATIYRRRGGCCAGETYSDQGSSAPRRGHRHSSGDDAAGHRVACRSWWKSQALCGAVGKQELSVSSRDELGIRHGVRVEGKGKRGKKQGPVSRSVSEVGVAVFSSSEVRMQRESPGARKKKWHWHWHWHWGMGNGDYKDKKKKKSWKPNSSHQAL